MKSSPFCLNLIGLERENRADSNDVVGGVGGEGGYFDGAGEWERAKPKGEETPLGLKSPHKCLGRNLVNPTIQFITTHAGGLGTVEYDHYGPGFGFP